LQRFLPGSFGFIPVKLEERQESIVQPGQPSDNPVFSVRSGSSEGNCSFEITYPNGTRLKIAGSTDYDLVKSLLLLNR
jgi:hypothetical protein